MVIEKSDNRKILIISYLFPPLNNIGALRTQKFFIYLPQFGWDTFVVTANSEKRSHKPITSKERNETRIFRTAASFNLATMVYNSLGGEEVLSPRPQRKVNTLKKSIHSMLRFLQPLYMLPIIERLVSDPIFWYFTARKQAVKIIKDNNIKLIFSTSNPPTAHFIASWLQKKTGVTWLAEFRDPWVDPYDERSWLYEFIENKLEKRVLKRARSLIAVSEPNARLLETIHHKQVTIITNGFDENDYKKNVPLTDKFTITYTGSIYAGKRDPKILFAAVAEMKKGCQLSPDQFELRFFGGNVKETLSPLVEKFELDGLVKIHGQVPLYESIKAQKESTILLLLEWNNPRAVGAYGAKVFEYLGAARPILALGYKTSVIDQLLSETGAGVLVDEVETATNTLKCWFEEWQKQKKITSHWQPNPRIINKYSRFEQTRKLAVLLDEISKPI